MVIYMTKNQCLPPYLFLNIARDTCDHCGQMCIKDTENHPTISK